MKRWSDAEPSLGLLLGDAWMRLCGAATGMYSVCGIGATSIIAQMTVAHSLRDAH